MPRPLLLLALWLLAATPWTAAQTALQRPAPAPALAPKAAAPAAADTELLLRSCAGEAQRNAKLYVARAHGIELMKRSADRDQGRSMLRIEAQLDGLLAQLRGKGGVDAELSRMEDALVGLTELTLQQPVVSQIDAALRLASRASEACTAALGKDTAAASSASRPALRPLGGMLDASQRLSARFLAYSLKPGGPSAPEAAELQRDAAAFDADLARLRQQTDDRLLADTLVLIDHQWLFMRQALARPRENARSKIEDVGRASEKVFELIDAEMGRGRRTPSQSLVSR